MNILRSLFAAALTVCISLAAPVARSAELPAQFHGVWAPDCQSPEAALLGMEVQADMVFYGMEECSILKATSKGKGMDIELECMVMMDVTGRKVHWEPAANGGLVETDQAKPGQTVSYMHCPGTAN